MCVSEAQGHFSWTDSIGFTRSALLAETNQSTYVDINYEKSESYYS